MPRSNRLLERLLRVLFGALCLATALAPLARSGFVGDDVALLGRASGLAVGVDAEEGRVGSPDVERAQPPAGPLALSELPPIEAMQLLGDDAKGDTGSLLSGYSIGLSLRLLGTEPVGPLGLPTAFWYRFENFVWLVVAALGLWRFLWRIFRPWVGSEQATRASSAAAFLFVLHPLSVPSVAAVSGRADAMALAFGAWAAAAFLRGRQERRPGFVQLAGLLTLIAGLCGQLALIIPFSLALAEVFSSYRYRPLTARLRTALVTLVVFSVVVQLNAAVVSTVTGHGYYPVALVTLSRLGDLDGALRALALSIEKLGVLLLPANLATLGLVGLFGAGLLGLVALQPALIAARTAPRLWGWTLVCWLGAVGVSLLFGVHERVRLDGLATATTLLPAAAAMCAGWGLAATALPGLRRLGVPIVLALGLSVLAHGNAVAWARGAEAFADTVEQVRQRAPRAAAQGRGVVLLVDAPRRVAGLDPFGSGLEWVLHPLFAPGAPWPPPLVVDVPADALGAVVRSGLWESWRGRALRVGVRDADGTYGFVDVPEPRDAADGLVPDPALVGALRVTAGEAPPPGAVVVWRGAHGEGQAPLAVWAGEPGARVCWVDLSSEPRWLLGGPVTAVLFEGLVSAPSYALHRDLPVLALAGGPTRLAGGDWSFGALDAGTRATDPVLELRLLDLDTLETRTFPLRPDRSGALVVAPPMDLVYRAREYGDHDFAYEVTLLVDGRPQARAHGPLPAGFLR